MASADLEKQIRTIETQIKNGNYAKPKTQKRLYENDVKWLKNKKKLDDIKAKLNKLEAEARESKKTKAMIAMDIVAHNISRRLLFFGSLAYQTKLSVAALTTLGTKLPKEIATGIYSMAFPELAKKSPIEANFSGRALGKFFDEATDEVKFLSGTKDIILSGKSRLDEVNSKFPEKNYTLEQLKKDYEENYAWYAKYPEIALEILKSNHIPVVDLLTTDLHAVIKDPIKRGSYGYAFSKYMDYYRSLGMDLNDPLLVGLAQDAAYRYAKAEIFMGSALDSKGKLKSLNVTEKINNLIKKAENDAILEGKNGKYAASKLYNIIYPVVGVGARILDVVVQSIPVWFGKILS